MPRRFSELPSEEEGGTAGTAEETDRGAEGPIRWAEGLDSRPGCSVDSAEGFAASAGGADGT